MKTEKISQQSWIQVIDSETVREYGILTGQSLTQFYIGGRQPRYGMINREWDLGGGRRTEKIDRGPLQPDRVPYQTSTGPRQAKKGPFVFIA